jgi:hypothetical protein
MPKSFEDLRERLLRAGVAPRHVRAYLAELREHLADLTEREAAAGGGAGEALRRARAALGDDETLAAAMLSRPGVRSWTARAPWLVLGLLPPVLMLLAMMITVILLIAMPSHKGLVTPFATYRVGPIIVIAGNLLITPAIAALFALIVWRQRLAPAWALAASAVALLFFLHMEFRFGAPDFRALPPGFRLFYTPDHQVRFGLYLTPVFHPRTWRMMAAQWPLVLAQYALTVLPAGWVWWEHHRRSAA